MVDFGWIETGEERKEIEKKVKVKEVRICEKLRSDGHPNCHDKFKNTPKLMHPSGLLLITIRAKEVIFQKLSTSNLDILDNPIVFIPV